MNLKKALLLSLLAGKMLSSCVYADAPVYESVSDELYAQLDTMDQPVGYFKSTNKYPYSWVYDPRTNSLRQVLCGSYNREVGGNVEIKQPDQLLSISPLRFSVMNLDQSTLEDVKYRGYRDTVVGQVVEEFLKTIKLIPDRHFKGRLFVDEYQDAIPQKWVFANAQEFGYLRKYIQANFDLYDIQPLDQKPLLVVEIVKGASQLTAQDVDFLSTYFTVVDPIDSKVAAFFKKNEKFALKAMALVNPFNKDKILIKQNFLEKQFHKLEDTFKKFSFEEFTAVTTLSVLGYVYKDHIMSWLNNMMGSKKKDSGNVIAGTNVVFTDANRSVVLTLTPPVVDQSTPKEKNIFETLAANSELIVGGAVGAVALALVLNYIYQSVTEKEEILPAVAYGFDNVDVNFSDDADNVNDVSPNIDVVEDADVIQDSAFVQDVDIIQAVDLIEAENIIQDTDVVQDVFISDELTEDILAGDFIDQR